MTPVFTSGNTTYLCKRLQTPTLQKQSSTLKQSKRPNPTQPNLSLQFKHLPTNTSSNQQYTSFQCLTLEIIMIMMITHHSPNQLTQSFSHVTTLYLLLPWTSQIYLIIIQSLLIRPHPASSCLLALPIICAGGSLCLVPPEKNARVLNDKINSHSHGKNTHNTPTQPASQPARAKVTSEQLELLDQKSTCSI